MTKFFTCLLLLSAGLLTASAQTATTAIPGVMPFGKIDKADLELTSCAFEKDANAEVLFDKADVYFDTEYNIIVEIHKRIKIFNDKGKDQANIRIEYYGGNRSESISNVQAETINLNNGVPEITKIDKKLIYTQTVDKSINALVFSLPNVKAGSVIEYKYTQRNASVGDFPDWYFQSDLPTRYSQFTSTIPEVLHYKNLLRVHQPFVRNIVKSDGESRDMAMADIPSLSDEPFMSSKTDNLECILYQLISITPTSGLGVSYSDTWNKVGEEMADFDDFGGQFKRKLSGEDIILAKVKTLKTEDEKIGYIFNEVKNAMKWDESYRRYTNTGTAEAWDKKTGNSTEINLMVYHLLVKAGIKAYPMLVSTRKNGKVNPAYPSRYGFNNTVAFVPIDSAHYYVLDATSKYNCYREIPNNLLNAFGLQIDKDAKAYNLVFIAKETTVRNVVLVSADIKANGKMEGTAQIYGFSYNRLNSVENYKVNGEKKYIDHLREDDNNLKISSIKFENMDVDTLPLKQNIDFNLDLTGSDETYIYFKPNLFTSVGANPFLAENRFTDIDFGYKNNYSINGSYKIPAGYKLDAMPKSVSMVMPDQTISFKRLVAEQEGTVVVRYIIDYKKSVYFKENYGELRDFYKKMYEMLNEQIVLKKS